MTHLAFCNILTLIQLNAFMNLNFSKAFAESWAMPDQACGAVQSEKIEFFGSRGDHNFCFTDKL